MSHGPIDLLVVRFPDNNFTGEITEELKNLVDAGTVKILDLMFVSKDSDDLVEVVELSDLDDVVGATFDAFVGDIQAFFSAEDVQVLADGMAPNSSAALVVYENTWASQFAEAVRNANGEVLLAERIPRAVIEALEDYDGAATQ